VESGGGDSSDSKLYEEEGFPSRGQAWSLEASLRCCIRYCWCREFVGLGDGCGFLLGGGEHGLLVGDGGRGSFRWHKHERGLRRCLTIDVDVCDGEKESGQPRMGKKPTIAFQEVADSSYDLGKRVSSRFVVTSTRANYRDGFLHANGTVIRSSLAGPITSLACEICWYPRPLEPASTKDHCLGRPLSVERSYCRRSKVADTTSRLKPND
jgi:hypothetical protein